MTTYIMLLYSSVVLEGHKKLAWLYYLKNGFSKNLTSYVLEIKRSFYILSKFVGTPPADYYYSVQTLWFSCSKISFLSFVFQICWFWAYMMKVIPKRCRVYSIWYQRWYLNILQACIDWQKMLSYNLKCSNKNYVFFKWMMSAILSIYFYIICWREYIKRISTILGVYQMKIGLLTSIIGIAYVVIYWKMCYYDQI